MDEGHRCFLAVVPRSYFRIWCVYTPPNWGFESSTPPVKRVLDQIPQRGSTPAAKSLVCGAEYLCSIPRGPMSLSNFCHIFPGGFPQFNPTMSILSPIQVPPPSGLHLPSAFAPVEGAGVREGGCMWVSRHLPLSMNTHTKYLFLHQRHPHSFAPYQPKTPPTPPLLKGFPGQGHPLNFPFGRENPQPRKCLRFEV